jgi:hypothetical protein
MCLYCGCRHIEPNINYNLAINTVEKYPHFRLRKTVVLPQVLHDYFQNLLLDKDTLYYYVMNILYIVLLKKYEI